MLVSLKTLNKFIKGIKLDLSVEKAINNLGYEVESITKFSQVEGIKFAKVLDVYKNEKSENLNVVHLLTNNGEITIQTVAKNAQKGMWAVAFVEGAKLGDIVFGAKKMAGVLSQGMLSGYPELGFDVKYLPYDEDDLIMLDDSKITLDMDPVEYFELDDYIIDITTPSNRADINSYYVLALELAAYYQKEFTWYKWDVEYKAKFKSKMRINKNAAKALSFFEVKLKNTETSLDDQLFLAKHKVEVKNNWAVDITNMNLLLTGVPTHAYDKQLIGNDISCDYFTGKVTILGNKEVEVENVLAIKDDKNVISLASVMGCENSSVSNKTTHIAFEIGSFDPKSIRRAAKQIKIDSNSSIQGARGVNNEMVRMGMKFLQYMSHKYKQDYSQVLKLPKTKKRTSIIQNRHKLATYANLNIKNLDVFENVEKQLEYIGFEQNKNRILTPIYRSDIHTYEDIIEEYFRFYGYNHFKPEAPYLYTTEVVSKDINKEMLKHMGYQEIRTFTLVSKNKNIFNPFAFEKNIDLETFVSLEREVVRNSIVPSMLEVAEYNIKRKIADFNLFENGMINNNEYVYGLISNIKDIDQMKQDITNFLNSKNLEFIPYTDNDYVHPNLSAKIYQNGEFIGWIGKVSPKYSSLNLVVAEFKQVKLNKNKKTFKEYSSEPLKTLDLTFALELRETIGTRIAEIQENFVLYDIKQIDSFEKENQKHITLRIVAESEVIKAINEKYNK
ncbi:phenylalanyl-tRNA synthetase subunit beta [Mycoplasmopsis columbina SF7]|uniref:Phenylalanine--tRNA ligase beta subunit n=1 Tax=Mycoplasmopsis columbina SF7 TaxID=1037410 RepID=F9UJS0_9BACT|nr:phenylalanine--tRNA ligase subunit beta [Mycoplasmopsis columbina]EGV00451.1 phenylalanyl-tRNA synthetase subunit beta [Mycoplasmopsis columbina SF7]